MKRFAFVISLIILTMSLLVAQSTPNPPRFVEAEIYDGNVNLTWTPPVPHETGVTWFSHTNYAVQYGLIGFQNVPIDMAHRWTQEKLPPGVAGSTLTHISFLLGEDAQWGFAPNVFSTVAVQVWTGGSGSPLSPGTMIHSQAVDVSTLIIGSPHFPTSGVWNEIELTEEITIPETGEIWLVVNFGPLTGMPLVRSSLNEVVQNYGNVLRQNNLAWGTINTIMNPIFNGNFLIRGRAVDESGSTVSMGHDSGRNFTFESYNIYRAKVRDIPYPTLWVPVATNFIPTDLENPSFTDTGWSDLQEGNTYRYIVQAVYANDNLSESVFSNALFKEFVHEKLILIGDRDSDLIVNDTPLANAWETGVSQVIFLANEINDAGNIKGIMLTHQGAGNSHPATIFRFWLATTDQEEFLTSTSWVPYDEFTPVFEGTIPEMGLNGLNDIFIYFDNPFFYDGTSNLVLLGHKVYFDHLTPNNFWQHTTTDDAHRSIFVRSFWNNMSPPFNNFVFTTAVFRPLSRANIGFLIDTQGPPLSVSLSTFSATFVAANETVNISWVTATENNLRGFNVFRAETDCFSQRSLRNHSMINPTNTSVSTRYMFEDIDAVMGQQYFYWLEIHSNDGSNRVFGPISVTIPDSELPTIFPETTTLGRIYPNPLSSNGTANFEVNVKENEVASLQIFNIRGQLINEITNITSGSHKKIWDGRDKNDNLVSSGIYFFRLNSASSHSVQRVIIIR